MAAQERMKIGQQELLVTHRSEEVEGSVDDCEHEVANGGHAHEAGPPQRTHLLEQAQRQHQHNLRTSAHLKQQDRQTRGALCVSPC